MPDNLDQIVESSEAERLASFRRVRDEIARRLGTLQVTSG